MDQPIYSNIKAFFDIIRINYRLMNDDIKKRVKVKEDGSSGNIIVFDYDQKSFKSALIIVVFVGIFIEAVLHILLVQKLGLSGYTKKIDHTEMKEKIKILGCENKNIWELCDQYIIARKELVHEKAYTEKDQHLIAQDEARKSVELMCLLIKEFKIEEYEIKMKELQE
jgi:hypothetical protein